MVSQHTIAHVCQPNMSKSGYAQYKVLHACYLSHWLRQLSLSMQDTNRKKGSMA